MIGQCVIVQQCSTKTVDDNFMQLETGLAIQIIFTKCEMFRGYNLDGC